MQRKNIANIVGKEGILLSEEENSKVDEDINFKGEQIERSFRYFNGVSDYQSRRTYVG